MGGGRPRRAGIVVREDPSPPGRRVATGVLTHLDTNFLVRAVGGRSVEAALLETWLRERRPVAVSSVTWAEFLCGPVAPAAARVASDIVGAPVAFGAAQAVLAADCFNAGGRRRRSTGDCMIAAAAITAGAVLATSNVADFQRFTPLGLRLAT